MSTHCIGFHPRDEKWEKMKLIWDTSIELKIPIPEKVEAFFNNEPPDPAGIRIDLEQQAAVSEYKGDMEEGFEIDITKLPPDIKIIRVFNSF